MLASGNLTLAENGADYPCLYGRPRDLLYVRETFCPIHAQSDPAQRVIEYDYRATYKHGDRMGDHIGVVKKWKPGIHMPRVASRLTLRITDVRVQRLQEINEEDAEAEGCVNGMHDFDCKNPYFQDPAGYCASGCGSRGYVEVYQRLWESINGAGSWTENPCVWALTFEAIKANIDQVLTSPAFAQSRAEA